MKDKQLSRSSEYILVSAPNRAGKEFISLLRENGILYYAITNNNHGRKRLEAIGIDKIIMVDTENASTWTSPEIQISNVYLFEVSFNLCCRYIQICKKWNPKSIHVVTKRRNTRVTYRGLGVDYLTYIRNNDISFLLPDHI